MEEDVILANDILENNPRLQLLFGYMSALVMTDECSTDKWNVHKRLDRCMDAIEEELGISHKKGERIVQFKRDTESTHQAGDQADTGG